MSGPESALGPLRRDDGTAAFDEPWQAQVLALADTLTRSGLFTPSDWSAALGVALRRAETRGAGDSPAGYYSAALEALEALVTASGTLSPEALATRQAEWRQAHLATPHGQPVRLDRR